MTSISATPFAITSTRILTAQGEVSGHLIIKDNIIQELLGPGDLGPNITQWDAGDSVVMPGIIDSHVHINEPGRTEWEGFSTATISAASGGITTLVDMPLNSSPVTTSVEAFQEKVQAAQDQLWVNCGFWGGLVPESIKDLPDLLKSGVLGIKVFLTYSGIPEFQAVTRKELRKAMPLIKAHDLPLLAHAELDGPLPYPPPLDQAPTSYQAFVQSRPEAWEANAIKLLIELCEEFKTRVHIVHLSSASSLPMIKAARKYLPLTIETCPHYLFFNSEDIPDGQPQYKCAPPIRHKENNERLWRAIEEGTIDFVVTDHSPAPPAMKALDSGNLKLAWGGISSLQFLLPLVWTIGQMRGLKLQGLSRLLSERTAKFLGLEASKGKIAPGYDADIVIWDPEASFELKPEMIRFRHSITPYIGRTLKGMVKRTYVNGCLAFDGNKVYPRPQGQIILK